jgi:hypothetical protein
VYQGVLTHILVTFWYTVVWGKFKYVARAIGRWVTIKSGGPVWRQTAILWRRPRHHRTQTLASEREHSSTYGRLKTPPKTAPRVWSTAAVSPCPPPGCEARSWSWGRLLLLLLPTEPRAGTRRPVSAAGTRGGARRGRTAGSRPACVEGNPRHSVAETSVNLPRTLKWATRSCLPCEETSNVVRFMHLLTSIVCWRWPVFWGCPDRPGDGSGDGGGKHLYQSAWHDVPEDSHLYTHSIKNLKCHNVIYLRTQV